MPRLFTSDGTPLTLGRELGSGGEGSVYALSTRPLQVAKLYHQPLDPAKQAKLRFMASAADDRLLQYVAWPQDTLHAHAGGEVMGFLMPEVQGKFPVHHLYNPASRLKNHPKAAWDFLLFVARNIAASFEILHSHGHVIGDVNENSVMAGADSTVTLIDSDSFQVDAAGYTHLCKVGVPNFTPPEIQTLSSFDQFRRTANHDNFGLALLIFHLLMGGRHPFSGVPLRAEAEPSLPADIRYFRYAYANDHQARGVRPPPGSVPVGILPPGVGAMFQKAFTDTGAAGMRPTATEWVLALDELRISLVRCRASAVHLYPRHLNGCPWCDLSERGIALFVDFGTSAPTPQSVFVLSQVWALIEAVTPPPALVVPYPANFKVKGMGLHDDIAKTGTILFLRLAVFLITLVVILVDSSYFVGAILCGGVGWVLASNVGRTKRIAEKRRRGNAEDAARQIYEALLVQAKRETGPQAFHHRKAEFIKLRAEWENLPQAEKEEIDRLLTAARYRQMLSYLSTRLVADASVPGVGEVHKQALKAAGISTAADITVNRLVAVPGVGAVLTSMLLQWRSACEAGFNSNAAAALSAQERNAVKAGFAKKRLALERALARGPDELNRWRKEAALRMVGLKDRLDQAAKELAEAEADLLILKY